MDVTNEQIERLRDEAYAHGDIVQAALCEVALGHTLSGRERRALVDNWPGLEVDPYTSDAAAIARAECERVIGEGGAR